MSENALMEVRTALATTTNVVGGVTSSSWGGAEINKKIESQITEVINRQTDLRQRVARKPMDQLTMFWNVRKDLGSTSKAVFQSSEGGTGTPYPSSKVQLYAMAKSLRSDYEVNNIMIAGSMSYMNVLADEASCAASELVLAEEKAMICGTDTNAYGLSNAYVGLLQLMNSYATTGDTTSIYGIARASGKTYLDVSTVTAGVSGTSTGVLELSHLDNAIQSSDDAGGKGDRRIFFCSTKRAYELNRLLQPQGRFVLGAGSLALEGGVVVTTYMGIPIISSRFMDKNGVTNTGSWDNSTDADNAMYLLDMDEIEFRVLAGVDATHVPIMGSDSGLRYDVQGGYFKTYGVFVMRQFPKQVLICNLTAP